MRRSWRIVVLCIILVMVTGTLGWQWHTRHDGKFATQLTNQQGWQVDRPHGNLWHSTISGTSIQRGHHSKLIYTKEYFSDSLIHMRIKLHSAAEAGLIFRASQSTNDTGSFSGYYLGLDAKHQQLSLAGIQSGAHISRIVLATRRMPVKVGKAYTLTVKAVGHHLQCFVNQKNDDWAKIDLIDKTYSNGMIGLRTTGAQATFSNLSVKPEDKTMNAMPTYTNAVLANVADPDVIYHDGTYYLYPTTTDKDAGGIKVYTSTDLVHWHDHGLAMKAGKNNWGDSGFWAPNVTASHGKFYMTYTANEHLCVSVSDSPLGPFKQPKFGPMHPNTKEIDAHVFKAPDGHYYLYFVRFTGGNVIYGAKLNPDLLTIDESTLTELLRPSQPWEKDMADVNEGPYMLYKDGKYFLTYSGSHFESPMYGVGYATSGAPLGHFTKYKFNPIMQSNSSVHGAGHHTFASSPDGKELFIIYHTHHDLTTTDPRKLAIDRVRFTHDANGQLILETSGPTVTPQPMPSGTK